MVMSAVEGWKPGGNQVETDAFPFILFSMYRYVLGLNICKLFFIQVQVQDSQGHLVQEQHDAALHAGPHETGAHAAEETEEPLGCVHRAQTPEYRARECGRLGA